MPGLQDLACSLCQHNGLFSLSLNKYSQCMTTNMKLYSKDQIMLKPLVLEQCIIAVVSFLSFMIDYLFLRLQMIQRLK